jgi:8-oxo-dGTP diphosphatase
MQQGQLERPVVAVDVVVLRLVAGRLAVLLHERAEEPFRGVPALPGVALRVDETLEAAARRALMEKGGFPEGELPAVYLEQLATFGAVFRDPRGRTVSIAHLGLTLAGARLAGTGRWTAIDEVPHGGLPFDHERVLSVAVSRLQGKIRYTNIARYLLSPVFRIEELQLVYEAVLGRRLNLTNFRTKLLGLGLIRRERVLAEAVGPRGGRPPHLYRFVQDRLESEDREFV